MPADDFKIARNARLALSRLRLDTNSIVIHCKNGALTINGRLQYVFAVGECALDLNYELLGEMDRQISHLDDVKSVEYFFDNWSRNSDGGWNKRKSFKTAAAAKRQSGQSGEAF